MYIQRVNFFCETGVTTGQLADALNDHFEIKHFPGFQATPLDPYICSQQPPLYLAGIQSEPEPL